jgi:hypothetical protein
MARRKGKGAEDEKEWEGKENWGGRKGKKGPDEGVRARRRE